MSKPEVIKQRISANIEQRKSLWNIQIVLIGSLSALFITLDSTSKTILFILGILAEILVLSTIKDINTELERLFKEMGEIK